MIQQHRHQQHTHQRAQPDNKGSVPPIKAVQGVGGAVGYVIDRMAGSRPFFLTAFLFLGGAAGILNVYRLAKAEDERKTNKE